VTYGKITFEEGRSAFKTFLDSYRKIRNVTKEEIQAIPDLGFAFWVFYLNFQYENYDDWSNAFFGPKFIKDRIALIKKWMEIAGKFLPE
jgi:Ser/Thr protein kinase RdoA (MazF antagonist)